MKDMKLYLMSMSCCLSFPIYSCILCYLTFGIIDCLFAIVCLPTCVIVCLPTCTWMLFVALLCYCFCCFFDLRSDLRSAGSAFATAGFAAACVGVQLAALPSFRRQPPSPADDIYRHIYSAFRTDYFMKAHSAHNVLWAEFQVGDGDTDPGSFPCHLAVSISSDKKFYCCDAGQNIRKLVKDALLALDNMDQKVISQGSAAESCPLVIPAQLPLFLVSNQFLTDLEDRTDNTDNRTR